MENTIIAIIGSTIIISSIIFILSNKIQNILEKSKLEYINYSQKRLNVIQDDIKNLNIIVADNFKNIGKNIAEIKQNINEKNVKISNELLKIDERIIKYNSIKNKLFEELKEKQNTIYDQNNDNYTNINNYLLSNQVEITHKIDMIRLSNFINVTNEISKYKNGIEENDNFIKEIGFGKVVQIINKEDNEITKISYLNDNEYESKIFVNDIIKYLMQYENNTLVKSSEYDKNHNIIFDYAYNEAGEITSKIEYIYDKNNKQIDKIETKY